MLDQYQIMTATALLRFWTLVLAAYIFLEEERDRLRRIGGHHATLGEACTAVQQTHRRHLVAWIHDQYHAGATPADLYDRLVA
jgi:hypothetical protein